jgi:hypothetical protein
MNTAAETLSAFEDRHAVLFGPWEQDAYTLPDQLTRGYRALRALADADPPEAVWSMPIVAEAATTMVAAALAGDPLPYDRPDLGSVRTANEFQHDWTRARDQAAHILAEDLAAKIYTGRDELIVEHLAPALADALAGFTADLGRAARWVPDGWRTPITVPWETLLEDDREVTRALYHVLNIGGRYQPIRAAWRFLHGEAHDEGPPGDPDSPLAEVRNFADLAPSWNPADLGRSEWPWKTSYGVDHRRLAWLVTHQADVWLPTRQQHRAQHFAAFPPPEVSPKDKRFINPFQVITTSDGKVIGTRGTRDADADAAAS